MPSAMSYFQKYSAPADSNYSAQRSVVKPVPATFVGSGSVIREAVVSSERLPEGSVPVASSTVTPVPPTFSGTASVSREAVVSSGGKVGTPSNPLIAENVQGVPVEQFKFWGGAGKEGLASTPKWLAGGVVIQQEGEGAFRTLHVLNKEGTQISAVNVYGMNVGTVSASNVSWKSASATSNSSVHTPATYLPGRQPASIEERVSKTSQAREASGLFVQRVAERYGENKNLELEGGGKLFTKGGFVVGSEFGGQSRSQEATLAYFSAGKIGVVPALTLAPVEVGRDQSVNKEEVEFEKYYSKYAEGQASVDRKVEEASRNVYRVINSATFGASGAFMRGLERARSESAVSARSNKWFVPELGLAAIHGAVGIPSGIFKTTLTAYGYWQNTRKAARENLNFFLRAQKERSKEYVPIVTQAVGSTVGEYSKEGRFSFSPKASAEFIGGLAVFGGVAKVVGRSAGSARAKLSEAKYTAKLEAALAPRKGVGTYLNAVIFPTEKGFVAKYETIVPFRLQVGRKLVETSYSGQAAGRVFSPSLRSKIQFFQGKESALIRSKEHSARIGVELEPVTSKTTTTISSIRGKEVIVSEGSGKAVVARTQTPLYEKVLLRGFSERAPSIGEPINVVSTRSSFLAKRIIPKGVEFIYSPTDKGASMVEQFKYEFVPRRTRGSEFKVFGADSVGGVSVARVQRVGGYSTNIPKAKWDFFKAVVRSPDVPKAKVGVMQVELVEFKPPKKPITRNLQAPEWFLKKINEDKAGVDALENIEYFDTKQLIRTRTLASPKGVEAGAKAASDFSKIAQDVIAKESAREGVQIAKSTEAVFKRGSIVGNVVDVDDSFENVGYLPVGVRTSKETLIFGSGGLLGEKLASLNLQNFRQTDELKNEMKQETKSLFKEAVKSSLKVASQLKMQARIQKTAFMPPKITFPKVKIPFVPIIIPTKTSAPYLKRAQVKFRKGDKRFRTSGIAPWATYAEKSIEEARTGKPAKSPTVLESIEQFVKSRGTRVPTSMQLKRAFGGKRR